VLGQLVATGIVPKFYEHLKRRSMDPGLDLFSPGKGV
jgi:pilus assembly protein CpaF